MNKIKICRLRIIQKHNILWAKKEVANKIYKKISKIYKNVKYKLSISVRNLCIIIYSNIPLKTHKIL